MRLSKNLTDDEWLKWLNTMKEVMRYSKITVGDLIKLSEFNILSDIARVLRGEGEVVSKKHIIDCFSPPTIPRYCELEENRQYDKFEWSPDKLGLYTAFEQRKVGNGISSTDLRLELAKISVLNANAARYLYENQEIIPNEWKDFARILFWGTIFRDADYAGRDSGRPKRSSICYLKWMGNLNGWILDFHPAEDEQTDNTPAAFFRE